MMMEEMTTPMRTSLLAVATLASHTADRFTGCRAAA